MRRGIGHGCRRLILGALVVGIGAAGAATPRAAHANSTHCRSDPVVSLWNLGQLDLSADVSDAQSDVQKVVYVIHAPAGSHLLSVLNTDGLIGLRESVEFHADNLLNTFDVYTTVYTGRRGVTISAQTVLVSPLNLNLGWSSVSGLSNTAIRTHFKSLL